MKKTLKHLLPALFLAAVMALLTGCTKSVDLLQYADVTFDGASGNATATVTLDYNGLGKELFSKGKDQDIWDEAVLHPGREQRPVQRRHRDPDRKRRRHLPEEPRNHLERDQQDPDRLRSEGT